VRTDLAAGIVSFLFTDIEGGREALWYRIPDSLYSVPCVPPNVMVGGMSHLGRMKHDPSGLG
jgi:hypothetical protein